MGIPRHNLFKKLREQKQDIVKKFCSDCKKIEITEDTRVVITVDGNSLKYSIKKGKGKDEKTLASSVTTDYNRETFFALFEIVHNDFETIEVMMSSPKVTR
jgi:hypothetical protein